MRHLYTRSPDIPGPPKSLHRSYLQDLFTRPLWEISIQELSTRSLHKTSIQELSLSLSARSLHRTPVSPDIPGPPRSLHSSSVQDPFTRPLREISIQDLLISRDLWDLLTTRSFQKTSIRIQHAESTERVARTKSISTRSLHKTFMRVSTKSLCKTSMRDTRSLHKTPMRDLYTRALYKVSSQAPNETSLCKISWYPWTS